MRRHSAADTTRALASVVLVAVAAAGCASADRPIDEAALRELAAGYTAAWGSQDPARVAAFYAEDGSLKVNDGPPAVGREAIVNLAQEFMTALPDMVLMMDSVQVRDGGALYFWTLTGTNTGPGGTGNAVWVSGYEEWTLDAQGLIARSLGHFPAATYERQLRGGGWGGE